MTNFSGMKSSTRTFVVFIVLVSVIILPVQSFSQEGDPSTELEPVNDTTVDPVPPSDVTDPVELADVNVTTIEPADVNVTTIEPADVNVTTIEPADVIAMVDIANVTGAIQVDEEEIPLMLIIAVIVAAAVIGGVIAYSKSRKRTTEKVATKKFCGKCGAAIDTNYKFCRKCGKSLPKK